MMSGRLVHITRHPIKAYGREALAAVELSVGACLPGDRRWAVLQEGTPVQPGWNRCILFSRGAKSPHLMAVTAELDEAAERVTLRHPVAGTVTFRPDDQGDWPAFLNWARGLTAPGRAGPVGLTRHDGGMTDSDYPSVSILSLASLADLGARMGIDLSIHRFRANFWIDGAAPWAEEAWVGRHLRLGDAVIEITEPIGRCVATTVDPETGAVRGDTLKALGDAFGHTRFGVFGRVVQGGRVARGQDWSLS